MAERLVPGTSPLLLNETGMRQAYVPGGLLVNESAVADDPLYLIALGKDMLLDGGLAHFSIAQVAIGAMLEVSRGAAVFSASLQAGGRVLELAAGVVQPTWALGAVGGTLEVSRGAAAFSESLEAGGRALELATGVVQPTVALDASGSALELVQVGIAARLIGNLVGSILEAVAGITRLFTLTSERATAQRTFTVRDGARPFRVPAESHRMVVPKERPAAVIRADNRRSKVTP